MTDKHTLDLARVFAESVESRPSAYDEQVRAAAEVVSSLPDQWVGAEKLREVVADHHIDMSEELMEALGALLPTPPAPEPAAPRPDDEPVVDSGYIFTDRDGDEWEYIDGRWIAGDTHAERVTEREIHSGAASLPEVYGPYTRIEA